MLAEDLEEVHVTWLEGLGSSYRMKGFFTLKNSSAGELKINFEGVAFGGNFGGHNVNVNLPEDDRSLLLKEKNSPESEIEDLLSEIQRRLLNNEMIIEYDSIKPEEPSDGLGI